MHYDGRCQENCGEFGELKRLILDAGFWIKSKERYLGFSMNDYRSPMTENDPGENLKVYITTVLSWKRCCKKGAVHLQAANSGIQVKSSNNKDQSIAVSMNDARCVLHMAR
jgi:hypothetical protein